MAGDPLRGIGGIKRRLLRRSLSVQESSFVNFVGVRVKALRELSHAARPVRFQSPFRPVASARAAKPCFFRGYFQANRNQQRLRAGGIHPGVNCACLSQRSATESASSSSFPSRSSSAMSGATMVSTRPKLWLCPSSEGVETMICSLCSTDGVSSSLRYSAPAVLIARLDVGIVGTGWSRRVARRG